MIINGSLYSPRFIRGNGIEEMGPYHITVGTQAVLRSEESSPLKNPLKQLNLVGSMANGSFPYFISTSSSLQSIRNGLKNGFFGTFLEYFISDSL